VHTPPARGLVLETSAPAGAGRTGLGVEVDHQAGGNDATAGALRLRRGLDASTEISVEGTSIHVPPSDPSKPTDQNLDTWAIRAGAKHRLSRAFAVTGGAGGGIYPGGPFVAPDGGLIASWNNGAVEPFAAARISVSLPLESRQVIENGGRKVPVRAWYYGPTLGLRVPLGWGEPKPGELRGAILAGATYTWVVQDLFTGSSTSFMAYGGGAELSF
jgi:hypothetical protein